MKQFIGALLFIVSTLAVANCPALYPHKIVIRVPGTVELCNMSYVSVYDEINRRVIFTSELLQPGGHVIQRKESFHADSRVINPVRPEEYSKSGYDRGHMVPADDSTSAVQMYESFLMTNMTPQNPSLNRGRWAGLERIVRKIATSEASPIWVITGALYDTTIMANGIMVPTSYYKIVYFKSGTRVFYVLNNKTSSMQEVSFNWINQTSHIKFAE